MQITKFKGQGEANNSSGTGKNPIFGNSSSRSEEGFRTVAHHIFPNNVFCHRGRTKLSIHSVETANIDHYLIITMPPHEVDENITCLNNETALSTALPDADGYFGDGDQQYGGAFLPPPLVPVMKEIDQEYQKIKTDPDFLAELAHYRKHYIGRPSPIYECKNLSKKLGGATIYLKREDLNHTGSHKINHCLGEALLAKKMGKSKLIAETGAGQHGVALATAASLMQMECEIHMGEIDIKKEWPNVRRMQVLGATVVPATEGGKSLKEAVDSACK
jgi:Pyridoxal-phosphate dependent enzyme